MTMKNWLKENPVFNISAVERLAQVPPNTLKHFLAGRQKLTEENETKLAYTLAFYGYVPTPKHLKLVEPIKDAEKSIEQPKPVKNEANTSDKKGEAMSRLEELVKANEDKLKAKKETKPSALSFKRVE